MHKRTNDQGKMVKKPKEQKKYQNAKQLERERRTKRKKLEHTQMENGC